MKKLQLILLFVTALFVSGCSEETFHDRHKDYLSTKGWTIKESSEVETYTLNFPDEMLRNYEASGIIFLREHLGEEIKQYSYTLKEKDMEGERLRAVVFEVDGEIIGGHGVLPSWDPGLFHLDDKERLIHEQLIKP